VCRRRVTGVTGTPLVHAGQGSMAPLLGWIAAHRARTALCDPLVFARLGPYILRARTREAPVDAIYQGRCDCELNEEEICD